MILRSTVGFIKSGVPVELAHKDKQVTDPASIAKAEAFVTGFQSECDEGKDYKSFSIPKQHWGLFSFKLTVWVRFSLA